MILYLNMAENVQVLLKQSKWAQCNTIRMIWLTIIHSYVHDALH